MPGLEGGLYTDCAEVNQPTGTYRFAKGVVDGNTPGSKENEAGFTTFGIQVPYTVIGVIPIDTGFVVFSTNTAQSEIGLWVNGVYSTIYNNPLLAFTTSAPIKGEYRIEATGNRVITWIDDNNPPRILNIDNLSLINNVNDLTIFQDINNPSISAYSISDTGGSLPCGAYVPFTYYKGNDGSVTNFFVHDKTFYINDDPKSVAFNLDDGAVGLIPTNKAINITFAGCDTNFDNLVVGFIRIANQVTTAWSAITKSVGSTVDVTITGSESLTSVSLDQILTAGATYNNAKAITQVNNQLVLANLTAAPFPDFQAAALAIQVSYVNDNSYNVISNVGSQKDVTPPSLMPGEVYALYIGLELLKGGWAFYHIPGRPPMAGETDTIVTDGLSHKRYQIENTSNSGGVTNMGYWENISETYPVNSIYNGGGALDLRGLPVRHHRMPTLTYLESVSSTGATGISTLHRLTLSVANVNIPVGIQSQIKRWKIFFAKKSPGNSIVGGSDILQYSFGPNSPGDDPSIQWSTGGNWGNDAVGGGFNGFDASHIHTNRLLAHSLDWLYAPGEFSPDFAWFHYGLTSTGVDTQWNGFRGTGGLLSLTGNARGQTAGCVVDYTIPSTSKTTVGQLRSVKNTALPQYVPQNSKINQWKSAYTETFIGLEISPLSAAGSLFTDIPIIHIRASTSGSWDSYPAYLGQFSNSASTAGGTGHPETVYMQYGRLVANAHTSFTAQDLIPLEGYYSPTTTNGTFIGGDTFMCYMSYLACAPLTSNQATNLGAPTLQGVRAWHAYIGYSKRNWNYRHQTVGDVSTYYYGKTDITTLFSPPLSNPVDVNTRATTGTLIATTDSLNNLTYNPDFNSLNEFIVGTTFSVDLINATKFPDLIIYSTVQGTESKDISWRIFPAGNRFTMPKNKGAIINLQGISNRDLLIHCQYTLYKTRTDVGMEADGVNVFLKSNELFAIQPEEQVSSSSSYAGTTNKFSCILTKMGYFSVDDAQGKVFLFTDHLEEISTNGLRRFFRDNMGVGSDLPFSSRGYTAAYDEKYNRILLTMQSLGNPNRLFTISYNPIKKVWISYHGYFPDYMFNTLDNKLYSYKSNALYQHGTGPYGIFYDGTAQPMILDVVHNPEPKDDKVFTALSWLSESYDVNNVLQYFDTIGYITLRSLDHCSNRTATVRFTGIDGLYTENLRNKNRTWLYNEFRDIAISPGFTQDFYHDFQLDLTKLDMNMEWFDQRKFIDKFVICRLEYPNTNNNRFLLMEIDIEYEKK